MAGGTGLGTNFGGGGGGGGGGGAATIADGADVAEGSTTDPAVVSGAAGSLSAKLRSISRDQTGGGQKTQIVDGSGNVQPSGDTAARAAFVKPTDGTNVPAVKGASTASAAADPSTVTNESPNSQLSTAVGTTADAAVTTNTTGTLSAKLRGLVAIFADVWDSGNHWLQVKVMNSNNNGRATSGNSSPVVPPAAASTWHLVSAASTNATSVKGSAATLFSCQLGNIDSTVVYLKIYNKATSPTVGTDTPVKTLIIPKAATAADGAGSNITFGPGGLALGTGFAAAITAGITVADTTAVSASKVIINCDYE